MDVSVPIFGRPTARPRAPFVHTCRLCLSERKYAFSSGLWIRACRIADKKHVCERLRSGRRPRCQYRKGFYSPLHDALFMSRARSPSHGRQFPRPRPRPPPSILPSRLVSCSSSTRIRIVRNRVSNESGYTQSSHSEQKMAPVVGSTANVSFVLYLSTATTLPPTHQTRIGSSLQSGSRGNHVLDYWTMR